MNEKMLISEDLGMTAKAKELIAEFELPEPNHALFLEAQHLFKQGLPLVKSIQPEALKYLLETGELSNEKARTGVGFEYTYFSICINKGYGPFTLILSPKILTEGAYTPFMVDHASRYVGRQVAQVFEEHPDKSIQLDEFLIQQEIMKKYTLNLEDFNFLYPYCLASLTEHLDDLDPDLYEEKIRYITFDIGLDKVRLQDIARLIDKMGRQRNESSEELCAQAISQGLQIEQFVATNSNSVYAAENELTKDILARLHIPEKFHKQIRLIG